MPYKDTQKRKEAYRRWVERNKEKKRNYQKILFLARKSNPIRQKCIIAGCENFGERHHPDYSKPVEIEWLCRKHHKATKHHGKCSICGDKTTARGYCNKHYKSERQKVDAAYKEATRVSKIKKRIFCPPYSLH